MGFVDLHCHLLPGIDDGAPDLAYALALSQIAVDDGITHMVCSPHIHRGRFDNTKQSIQAALNTLRDGLQEEGIALQISASAEVRFDLDIMMMAKADQLPFVGRWDEDDVLLLELPHGEVPVGALQMVRWLVKHGIRPMIAHPERNKTIMRDPKMIRPFIQEGCLLQVTAGAVAGGFGAGAQAAAQYLLEEDWVTILATDAHNIEHRPPVLTQGVEAAALVVGEEKAMQLVTDNPWRIAQTHFEA